MTVIEHGEFLVRAINAVQEEFDEHGLGEADLLVRVILDESGYAEALRGAATKGDALADAVASHLDAPTDATRDALLEATNAYDAERGR